MTTAPNLLQTPIELLPLSDDLKALLSLKGYLNLHAILQQNVSDLRTRDGLDMNHELELYNLVTKNGLVSLWREE